MPAPAAPTAASATPPAAPEDDMAIVRLHINGLAQEVTRPLLRREGRFLATALDLRDWNLAIPRDPSLRVASGDYYDLASLPGARLKFDEGTQTIDLLLAPEAFVTTVGAARGSERPPLAPSVFSAFMNYDLVVQQDRDGTRLSGLIDASTSADWGNLATNVLAGQTGLGTERTTRLDSAFTRDDPDRLRRLTVGDSVTQAAPWSTPVRFGGIQFGTHFGLQPGFVTYPLPTLRGGTAVPSTVEVFVDNVLRYQQPVQPGPFAIDNVPVLSGAGQMRFAVTDALGVQRYVNLPYYVSSNLLREGLSDYSVEAGWTRRRYGEADFDYGRPFVSGLWRHGFSQTVTLDTRAEASASTRTAGAGVTWVWTPVGEFSLHGAFSSGRASAQDPTVTSQAIAGSGVATSAIGTSSTAPPAADVPSTGRLLRASFTRNSTDWNFSAVRQQASRGFTEVGFADDYSHLQTQSQVFAGRSLGRLGTLGASYTRLTYSGGDRVSVASLNWSIPVGTSASFGTYLTRSQQNTGVSATSIGFTFSMSLGQNRSGSASLQRTGSSGQALQVEYSQLPPGDLGVGWRVNAARGNTDRAEAGVDWRTRTAVLSADVANVSGQTATRLQASGAVGTAGGLFFATRASTDAFALVTVEGAPGIMVYRENQPWAATDASGRVVIPGLRAYGTNHLSIEPGDLPIEVTLRRDTMLVVPRYRGVADVHFDLSNEEVVEAHVLLPDGTPLPAGVDVFRGSRDEKLVAGFDGALSIGGPVQDERFEARWGESRCDFTLGDIPKGRKLPLLGPFVCRGSDNAVRPASVPVVPGGPGVPGVPVPPSPAADPSSSASPP